MKTSSNIQTLAQAKTFLRENYKEGAKCPCCNQTVKLYKRKITSAIAFALYLIYKHIGVQNPVHLEDFFKSLPNIPNSIRGDVSKLRHWNLIERGDECPKEDGNPRDGYYFLTKYGASFVRGEVTLNKNVHIYNNKIISIETEQNDLVTFKQCLGDKFNYKELMES